MLKLGLAVLIAALAGTALLATRTAVAEPDGIVVTPLDDGRGRGSIGIVVGDPGSPGTSSGSDGGQASPGSAGQVSAPNPCSMDHPGSAACSSYMDDLYCSGSLAPVLADVGDFLGPPGCESGGPAPPSAAQLAQVAYGQLDLPQPTINRSPDESNSDPAFGGQPYTWINLWTWYWTDSSTWVPQSKTVSAGAVSATVTATPVRLVFDPGDGNDPVSCAGPGRPWAESDGDGPPAGGGCGYVYRSVTRGSTPLTSTVTIVWDVGWVGSDGTSGTFEGLETSASSSFIVEQIQVVNR